MKYHFQIENLLWQRSATVDLLNAGLMVMHFPETINRESETYSRIFWMLNNDHCAIHSVDFCHITVLANITSRNESKWEIIGVSISDFFLCFL